MKLPNFFVLFVFFASMLGCKDDPCESTSCLNGGTLVTQKSGCNCNCAGTGYQGENCETKILELGVEHEGGIIFYLDNTGEHGLIAAKEDASISAPWGCTGTLVTEVENATIGSGSGNTTAIVNACTTAGIAAKVCYNFSSNGKSDWYLPAEDELLQLYKQKGKCGEFKSIFYWSSTSYSAASGRFINFNTGEVFSDDKSYGHGVRSIRSF